MEIAERFKIVAGTFDARVTGVPDGAWGNPSPCDGWTARDIVRHLVEWVPGFFSNYAAIKFEAGPTVDDDPVGAWKGLYNTISAVLADESTAGTEIDGGPIGRMSLAAAIDMIVTGDLLIHTWDLARATGQDETLDARGSSPNAPRDRTHGPDASSSGQYAGPRVRVADDASEQAKLLAFMGRDPGNPTTHHGETRAVIALGKETGSCRIQ